MTMLIKNGTQHPLLKYQNPTPKQGRFLQAARDNRNEGLNQIAFENGEGGGMGEGLWPSLRVRFLRSDGKLHYFRRVGNEWAEVPKPPRRGNGVPKRCHVATGRKISMRKT